MISPLNQSSYSRISPTAWIPAYARTFSDIPFSREIFAYAEETDTASKEMVEELIPRDIIPVFEARYKMLDRRLTREGNKNIFELAAGVACRGLLMTRDPDIRYIELDLPGLRSIKEKIISDLSTSTQNFHPDHLFLETGNALNLEDITHATRQFHSGPVSVLHEGFLRYLSHQEIRQLASNIHSVLERFGGVWITPDITLKSFLKEDEARKSGDKLEALTGRHILQNAFDDEVSARSFFEDLGFIVESHCLREFADELVSPSRINMTKEHLEERVYGRLFFVMRLR